MTNWVVFKTGGKQYKVEEGDTVSVEKLNVNGKSSVNFDQVLAVSIGDKIQIGKPFVEKAKVRAKVLENFKDTKIKVVKFKSKSRYLRTQGHFRYLE